MRRIILMIWIAALAGTCYAQPLMISKEHYRSNLKTMKGYTASCGAGKTIPHKIEPEQGGTVILGTFGDAPEIVQVEGHGTGMNVVEITDSTHDAIMKGSPWKADKV